MFGRTYSDVSFSFESLTTNPREILTKLFDQLSVKSYNLESISTIIERGEAAQWGRYADDSWFSEHENVCERTLRQFFENSELTPITNLALEHYEED